MRNWEFHDPWWLMLALLAPAAYYWSLRRGRYLLYSSTDLVRQLPITWRVRLRNLPALLLGLSVLGVAIGMARPRTPDEQSRVHHEGIAIMMVVDRSGSMEARDLVPQDVSINRLHVAKKVLRDFVLGSGDNARGRPDDLVGLIGFAGYADSLCPLTTDHANLVALVDQLEIETQREEDGTAIGDALALAVERLRGSEAVSKIVILLTDGVNNAGVSSPQQAAELAKSYGVKIYSIGAGTEGLAPVPTRFGPGENAIVFQRERVFIDEATLRQISELTGGQYFRAIDARMLADIYRQIDQLERSNVTETRYLQYTEHFGSFLMPSLVFILAALTSRQLLFRAVP